MENAIPVGIIFFILFLAYMEQPAKFGFAPITLIMMFVVVGPASTWLMGETWMLKRNLSATSIWGIYVNFYIYVGISAAMAATWKVWAAMAIRTLIGPLFGAEKFFDSPISPDDGKPRRKSQHETEEKSE